MEQFEYLIPFVGIIYGLSAADLLSSFHRLIIERDKVKLHIVPLSWSVVSFLLIINGWWGFFHINQSIMLKSAGDLLLLSLLPLTLFLTIALSLPHQINRQLNLWEYFNQHKKPFYGCLTLYLLLIPTVLFLMVDDATWQSFISPVVMSVILTALIWLKHWLWHFLASALFIVSLIHTLYQQSLI